MSVHLDLIGLLLDSFDLPLFSLGMLEDKLLPLFVCFIQYFQQLFDLLLVVTEP